MTERLSPLLERGSLSTCSNSRRYLGSRATTMGCRLGEGRKGCLYTYDHSWKDFKDSGTQNSLLIADFLSEISVIFCNTPALKLSHSDNGRRVPPLAIGAQQDAKRSCLQCFSAQRCCWKEELWTRWNCSSIFSLPCSLSLLFQSS